MNVSEFFHSLVGVPPETKPVETDNTITDDDLLDIMDVSVHDVPIDK